MVGAGVIGVTTAWYLRREGFDVTVVERGADVATEASAANAGVIAPGYVTPWAAPGMALRVLRMALSADSPIVFRPRASLAQWRWAARWLRECDAARYAVNKSRMRRLAAYSRLELHALRAALGIEYGAVAGYLQLLRTPADRARAEAGLAVLRDAGVAYVELDARGCCGVEPALAQRRAPLHGGIHLPEDEAGDCARFTRALRTRCEAAGVRFIFGHAVEAIEASGRGTRRVASIAVRAPGGPLRRLRADRYVLAAGVDSVPLAAAAGVALPLYPVAGCSITVPIERHACAPRGALMDEANKTAIVRLGDSLRVAGLAEVSGWNPRLRAGAVAGLRRVLGDWFGQAGRADAAPGWIGRRPMTPDGAALLGPTPLADLLVNVGHGSTGWAMACGSGAAVAALAAGRAPAIDLDGLTLARYGRAGASIRTT